MPRMQGRFTCRTKKRADYALDAKWQYLDAAVLDGCHIIGARSVLFTACQACHHWLSISKCKAALLSLLDCNGARESQPHPDAPQNAISVLRCSSVSPVKGAKVHIAFPPNPSNPGLPPALLMVPCHTAVLGLAPAVSKAAVRLSIALIRDSMSLTQDRRRPDGYQGSECAAVLRHRWPLLEAQVKGFFLMQCKCPVLAADALVSSTGQ